MIKLTRRQAEVLDYIERQDIPPSLREIGMFLNIRSTNGVSDHLKSLVRKGRIASSRGIKTRQIRVISRLTEEERRFYQLGGVSYCPTCGRNYGGVQ